MEGTKKLCPIKPSPSFRPFVPILHFALWIREIWRRDKGIGGSVGWFNTEPPRIGQMSMPLGPISLELGRKTTRRTKAVEWMNCDGTWRDIVPP